MRTYQKIIIGCLGGLTPILMNLLVIDIKTTLQNFEIFTFLGYFIRSMILCFFGGLVAFLHKSENNAVKLFELGVFAPAMITALINGTNVPKPTHQSNNASVSIISSAYAQTTNEKQNIKSFSLPKETPVQQFWKGLTGSTPKNVWFVIVGSHLNLEEAQKQVQQIARNEKQKDFRAEIYAPYGENPYYAVVVGANLTYSEAQQLKQRAIEAGFPKDTYLWTFPWLR